jgi:hypothetical protein
MILLSWTRLDSRSAEGAFGSFTSPFRPSVRFPISDARLTSPRRKLPGDLSPQIAFEGPSKRGKVVSKKPEPQNDHSGKITIWNQKKVINYRYFNERQLFHFQSMRRIFICSYLAWKPRNMLIVIKSDLRDSTRTYLS